MSSLTVSVSPHVRSKRTTQNIMLDVVIALMPALVASVFLFGFRSLLLTAVSVSACVLLEFGYEKLMKLPVTIFDGSAVVTGILVAFNVPVGMPVWQLLIGDIAAILLAKMLFGGLGKNFMNPALVGRVVMMFSFTTNITTFPDSLFHIVNNSGLAIERTADVVTSATPLASPELLTTSNIWNLIFGCYGGTIGETCTVALVLGGIYLLCRKVISAWIPVCYIGSTILFSFLFGGTEPLLSALTGGLFLGAIFMATDYVTSPITTPGKIIFGIFLGLITATIRVFGNYPEGVTFSILLGNVLVPYIRDLTLPKPLGVHKKKKEAAK